MSKEEGGVGVKHCDLFNKALISKWVWRILSEGARYGIKFFLSNMMISRMRFETTQFFTLLQNIPYGGGSWGFCWYLGAM